MDSFASLQRTNERRVVVMSLDDSSEYVFDLFLDTPINELTYSDDCFADSTPTDCLYCGAPLPSR